MLRMLRFVWDADSLKEKKRDRKMRTISSLVFSSMLKSNIKNEVMNNFLSTIATLKKREESDSKFININLFFTI